MCVFVYYIKITMHSPNPTVIANYGKILQKQFLCGLKRIKGENKMNER